MKKLVVSMLVLSTLALFFIQIVYADMYNAGASPLEIQGAKIVSEGGYFMFHLTNKANHTIDVTLRAPTNFTVSTTQLTLASGESKDIGVKADMLPPDVGYVRCQFDFIWQPPAVLTCFVYVVSIDETTSYFEKRANWTFEELLQNYNEVMNEQAQTRTLQQQAEQKLAQAQTQSQANIYIIFFVSALVFCLGLYLGHKLWKPKRR